MDQILEIKDSLMIEDFDSLPDSRERVEYGFEKMGPIEDIRQNVQTFLSDHKSENMKSLAKSQSFRQKGNVYFQKKNFEYALYYYSSAVMWAPYPTETGLESDNELTYAFTSRSLTFFEMKAYESALQDINSALILSELTMKFTDRLQLMTHKVYCLCRLRRYLTALTVITAMIQLIPCLPIHNGKVNSLIQMKDEIIERLSEESNDLVDSTQTENDLDSIENHLKNIESFRCPELNLCETETKGRHYTTTEDMPKGKIVAVEKAISAVLFKSFLTTHCQNCFKNVGYKGWPCRHCSQVVFCNQECADNAYYHPYECGIIEIIQKLGTNLHLLYRIILLVGPQMAIDLVKEPLNHMDIDGDSIEVDQKKESYLKFIQLIDHRHKYDLNTKVPSICRSIQMAFVLDFFEDFRPKDRLIEDFLKELSALLDTFNFKAFVNVFGIYEHMSKGRAFRGGHIGNAIMCECSFFNHSCSPNTYWVFNGLHISVVTTENIEKDQEVTISYGPYSQTMPLKERQSFLLKKYFFRCNCNECKTEAKRLPILKCYYCSDGFFTYESDSTESFCMVCGQNLQISSVIERVKETENSFKHWMNEFKRDSSELALHRAEMCYSNFCELLYMKSNRMIEINTKLSRSLETIENYSKAMAYSKNILDLVTDTHSFQYCIEMVFYSRVYYYYLYKQRKLLTIDDEWRKCFKTITETLTLLKTCKNNLVQSSNDESYKKMDREAIEKAIKLIDGCLQSKEQQISVISKMINDSSSGVNL